VHKIVTKRSIVEDFHFSILRKIRSVRFLLYGMGVLEFAFYSGHEILHHKLSTENGLFPSGLNFLTLSSYVLSIISFTLAAVETIQISNFAKQVFYAEDISEFPQIGEKSLSPSDCMRYFTYHVNFFFLLKNLFFL